MSKIDVSELPPNWRPENWKNPHKHPLDDEELGDAYLFQAQAEAYEEGADALLKALRRS
jgi:hypothetical protein